MIPTVSAARLFRAFACGGSGHRPETKLLSSTRRSGRDPIFDLPFEQFLISKSPGEDGFHFYDLTGKYQELSLRKQVLAHPNQRFKNALKHFRDMMLGNQ